MAAFSASRLVCSAIEVIVPTMSPMRSERPASSPMAALTAAEDSRTARIEVVASVTRRAPC